MKTRFLLIWVGCSVANTIVGSAYAACRPSGSIPQDWDADDIASLIAQGGVHVGHSAWVRNTGSGSGARYTGVPSGTFPTSSVHAFTGQNNVEWVDDFTLVTTFISIPNVSNTAAGLAPQISGPNRVMMSTNGTSAIWAGVSDAQMISVDWSKLLSKPTTASGWLTDVALATNQFTVNGSPSAGLVIIGVNGTTANWAAMPTAADATASTKGVVQLAGDICAGTATAPLVCKVNGSSVPAGGALTTGHVLQVTGASALGYNFVSNANIASGAAIDLSKIVAGGTNQVFANLGSGNVWSALTDALHGSRGNGNLHSLADALSNGFLVKVGGTANRVLLTTDGSAQTWGQIVDAQIASGASIARSKIVGCPSGYVPIGNSLDCVQLSSQIPQSVLTLNDESANFPNSYQIHANNQGSRGGGVLAGGLAQGFFDISVPFGDAPPAVIVGNSSSVGILNRYAREDHTHNLPLATTSTAGAMASSDKSKLDGLFSTQWTAADDGTLVVAARKPATASPGPGIRFVWDQPSQEVTVATNFTAPSGSSGAIAKFTSSNGLVNSSITDNGAGLVTVNGTLNAKSFSLFGTGATAQWVKIGTFAAAQSGRTIRIQAFVHAGYNASNTQDSICDITFKSSNGVNVDANGFAGNGNWSMFGAGAAFGASDIKWKANASGVSATSFDLYMHLPAYVEGSEYTVSIDSGATWTDVEAGAQSDPGSASATVLIPTSVFQVQSVMGIGTVPASGVALDVNGTIAVRGGSPGDGKLLQSDSTGTAVWSSTLSGLAGITFAAGANIPTITQTSRTGSAPTYILIQGQSATDSNWAFTSGDVDINVGTNAAGAKGFFQIGYAGNNGAYAQFSSSGESVNGSINASTSITVGQQTVEVASPYGNTSGITWLQSTSSNPTFCVSTINGSGLSDASYSTEWLVMAKGTQASSDRFSVTYLRNGGILSVSQSLHVYGSTSWGQSVVQTPAAVCITVGGPSGVTWTVRANVTSF